MPASERSRTYVHAGERAFREAYPRNVSYWKENPRGLVDNILIALMVTLVNILSSKVERKKSFGSSTVHAVVGLERSVPESGPAEAAAAAPFFFYLA